MRKWVEVEYYGRDEVILRCEVLVPCSDSEDESVTKIKAYTLIKKIVGRNK